MLTRDAANDPGEETRARPISRWMAVVVLLGAGYSVLAALDGGGEDSSILWFLDPLLVLGFAGGLWLRARRPDRLRQPVRSGWLLFVAGSWLTGMLYELSLRTGPAGFGGMHPDTATSFLWAQGYYVPFALGGWWLARRYGYSLENLFWAGALSSLYEMLTVGAPAVVANPALLPVALLLAGYYLTVYGLILALPLLFLDERALRRDPPRPIGRWGKIAAGVALGLTCWVAFLGWVALVG